MSICGPAEVVAIEACPEIEEGEGQIATATFHHDSGDVYDLQLEDESATIGVTGTHPFWSVDRNEWVPAALLQVGEVLKTFDGTTVLESQTKRNELEAVFNIEVNRDHVYRVGEAGMLVHNNSPGKMRFQVQWGTNQGGPTFSDVAEGTENCPSVTVDQALEALDSAWEQVVPAKAKAAAEPAVVEQRAWIQGRPPTGVGPNDHSWSRYFGYKKFTDARVDVENKRGLNLKE